MRTGGCALLISLLLLAAASNLPADNRGIAVVPEGSSRPVYIGNYHALIVGIDAYGEWNRLRTAVKDATVLRDVLVAQYGFKKENVVLRTNGSATRDAIITDLRNLAAGLGDKDNLLIYFAGHGQLDDLTGDGYWIPAEGKLKNPSTWVSHSAVKNILSSEKVRGKNIVVIADSCYSGSLLRGGPSLLSMTQQGYRGRLLKLASSRSRQVITSGGLEPVADGGRDGHSLFAYYLLKALKDNDRDLIDLENLFHSRVWRPVSEIGGQRPNVGRLKTPMDEDGQFILASSGTLVDRPGETTLSVDCDVSDASVLIDGLYVGKTDLSGAKVSAGEHRIRVEKDGYEPYGKRVRFKTGRSVSLSVILDAVTSAKGSLYVDTIPKDARVRILNTGPSFHQGIELDAGQYNIEASAPGYERRTMWVSLGAGEDRTVDMRLRQILMEPSSEEIRPPPMADTERMDLKGEVTRGRLGVTVQDVSEEMSEYYGIKDREGVFLVSVIPGDPADEAGLRANDIIAEINGKRVENAKALLSLVASFGVGETVRVKVYRNGRKRFFKIRVGR